MSEAQPTPDPLLDQPWRSCLGAELSARAQYALKDWKCETVRDVTKLTEQLILRVPGIGRKTAAEIDGLLKDHGLGLAGSPHRNGTPPLPFPTLHARLLRIEQELNVLSLRLAAVEQR